MDRNNYLGSFAQENVSFQTTVVETSSYGDNFKRVMVFADSALVTDTTALMPVEGLDDCRAATVTAETFASITTGILQSWLSDLFANGEQEEAYVVVWTGAEGLTETTLASMYDTLKPHAYFKTVCVSKRAGTDPDADPADASALDTALFATLAAKLADWCKADKQVLSGPVLAPYFAADPTQYASDTYYTTLKGKYVLLSYHPDATRNAAMYATGLALSVINDSLTPIGNGFDMAHSNGITPSGLSFNERKLLNKDYIQTWKYIGDNSPMVAAETANALDGSLIPADWIVAYVAYMSKVEIAQLITTMNTVKSAKTYANILGIMMSHVGKFTFRLSRITMTAPAYSALPKTASDEIAIPNAWEAHYVDNVRSVKISGTLYVGD